MPTSYTEETQKILEEFLETLRASPEINRNLLADLRQMLADGKLASPARITRAIDHLLRDSDGLQDQ